MNEISSMGLRKIRENKERMDIAWKRVKRDYSKSSEIHQFIYASLHGDYVPSTEGTKFFRIKYLNHKRVYAKTLLYKNACLQKIDAISRFFEDYKFEFIDTWCMSDIYDPEAIVTIRTKIVDLLNAVECPYWEYYDESLIQRGYNYHGTPMLDLAYICYDMSYWYVDAFNEAIRLALSASLDAYMARAVALKLGLQKVSNELVSLNDFITTNCITNETKLACTEFTLSQIVNRAHKDKNIYLMYDADRLYSGIATTYVMGRSLDTKRGFANILNNQYPWPAGQGNTRENEEKVLWKATESISNALASIGGVLS